MVVVPELGTIDTPLPHGCLDPVSICLAFATSEGNE